MRSQHCAKMNPKLVRDCYYHLLVMALLQLLLIPLIRLLSCFLPCQCPSSIRQQLTSAPQNSRYSIAHTCRVFSCSA